MAPPSPSTPIIRIGAVTPLPPKFHAATETPYASPPSRGTGEDGHGRGESNTTGGESGNDSELPAQRGYCSSSNTAGDDVHTTTEQEQQQEQAPPAVSENDSMSSPMWQGLAPQQSSNPEVNPTTSYTYSGLVGDASQGSANPSSAKVRPRSAVVVTSSYDNTDSGQRTMLRSLSATQKRFSAAQKYALGKLG